MANSSNFSLINGISNVPFKSIATEESPQPSRTSTPGSVNSTPTRMESKSDAKASEVFRHRSVSAPPLNTKSAIRHLRPQRASISSKTNEEINLALEQTAGNLSRGIWGGAEGWQELCASEIHRFNAQNALTALRVAAFNIPSTRNHLFCGEAKKLIEKLFEILAQDIQSLTPQDLANLLGSLAKLRYDNRKIIQTINTEILRKIKGKQEEDRFSSRDLAEILAAHARFGFIDPNLYAEYRDWAMESMRYWPIGDLCRMAWALAVLSNIVESNSEAGLAEEDMQLLGTLLARLEGHAKAGKLTGPVDLSQVMTLFNYLELFHTNSIDLDSFPNLKAALVAHDKTLSEGSQTSSLTHQEIQTVLEKMVKLKRESEKYIRGYFADIILDDHRIIEIQGPTHYLVSGKFGGDYALRTRIFRKMGYYITDIRVTDWDPCRTRHISKQKAFLNKRVFANSPMEAPPESVSSSPMMAGSTTSGHSTPLLHPKS